MRDLEQKTEDMHLYQSDFEAKTKHNIIQQNELHASLIAENNKLKTEVSTLQR